MPKNLMGIEDATKRQSCRVLSRCYIDVTSCRRRHQPLTSPAESDDKNLRTRLPELQPQLYQLNYDFDFYPTLLSSPLPRNHPASGTLIPPLPRFQLIHLAQSFPSAQMSQSNFTPALLAGALAGTTVDLTLFPLDTLKTRLQSSTGFIASGGFTGVYRGVGSAIIGSAPGAALFFCTYEATKTAFARRRDISDAHSLGGSGRGKAIEHMVAASLGEVAACAVRVPTEVVKQRAQAGQYSSSLLTLKAILGQYKSIGVTGVWRELYRGWSVTIMREVPFTIIQFPLWESMKSYRKKASGKDSVSAIESGLMGSFAGAAAAAATTPLDVLKTRMMLEKEKKPTRILLKEIIAKDGSKAFFAGIGPRVMWISIGGAIFLGSYQWAYNELARESEKSK